MAMSESQRRPLVLNEMTVRGAHWVAIDAARGDLAAPATLDRIAIPITTGPGGQEPVEVIVSSVRRWRDCSIRPG